VQEHHTAPCLLSPVCCLLSALCCLLELSGHGLGSPLFLRCVRGACNPPSLSLSYAIAWGVVISVGVGLEEVVLQQSL
jgi:hypothetical protein